MDARPRILAVDDEPNLLQIFQINLSQEGYDVDVATTVEDAHAAFTANAPDLAILDLYMEGRPAGIQLASWIRERSDVPILLLTAATSTEEALASYGSGVDDFVRKPFSPLELTAKVTALLRRSGRLALGKIRVGEVEVDPAGYIAMVAGTKLDLTKTEFDILALLARNAGRVVSKQQLLTDVWGSPHYTANVVEVHVSSLRRKVEAVASDPGQQLIETVRGAGYVLRG